MSNNELKQRLRDLGYEDTVVFESPDYAEAVMGVTDDGRVVCDFDKMAESLSYMGDMETAVEFIEYNTIRALPYMGEKAPIVCHTSILEL